MKKLMKRIIPLVLVVVMCFCMTVPAAAQSLSSSWIDYIATRYPYLESGYSGGKVGGLQSVLYNYGGTPRSKIETSGGVDCSFGSGTAEAVKAFQGIAKITADGKCGTNTWRAIAYRLTDSSVNSKTFFMNSIPTFWINNVNDSVPSGPCTWQYRNPTTGASSIFAYTSAY